MEMTLRFVVISVFALFSASNMAYADFSGRSLTFQDLITYSGPSPPFDPPLYGQPTVVAVGEETNFHWAPVDLAPWGAGDNTTNVAVTSSSLTFTFSSTGLYTYGLSRYTDFIGFQVYDPSNAYLNVLSISIDPASTLQGASVFLDTNAIDVNLKGTGVFYVGTDNPRSLVLDVTFSPTPEPDPVTLVGAFLAIRFAWWRLSKPNARSSR